MVNGKDLAPVNGVSLQMTLIQLRWQQLRQMELEGSNEARETLSSLPQDNHHQILYTAAA